MVEKTAEAILIGIAQRIKNFSSKKFSRKKVGKDIKHQSIYKLWKSLIVEDNEGSMVNIKGSISLFIPVLYGSPIDIKKFHLLFRNKKLIDNMMDVFPEDYINALISLTSGQLVWNPSVSDRSISIDGNEYYACSMYDCIVRNSILTLVSKPVFDMLRYEFNKNETYTLSCEVNGYVLNRKMNYANFIKNLLNDINTSLYKFLKDEIEALISNSHLRILIIDDKSQIDILGKATYLDGDIWVVSANSRNLTDQRLITRFINLADMEELITEAENIKVDCIHNGEIILRSFDESIINTAN